MNKIIALAVLGLVVTACDPYNDEKAATGIKYQMVTGRLADTDALRGGTMNGPWVAEAAAMDDLVATPSHGSLGRVIVVTTDGLLDGASIEQTPQSCLPVTGAWTFTMPDENRIFNTEVPPVEIGRWYTCYYPSSATATDGGSVFIYYANSVSAAPGPSTASQPVRAGRMVSGEYAISGSFRSKNGTEIPVDLTISVGQVAVSVDAADGFTVPAGTTAEFSADLDNRAAGATSWEVLDAIEADSGVPFALANAGAVSPTTGTEVTTYTAPATVPAPIAGDDTSVGGIFVTIRATNDRLSNDYTIWVSP